MLRSISRVVLLGGLLSLAAIAGGCQRGPTWNLAPVEGTVPIANIAWRQKARIAGRITSVEVQPWQGAQVLSCTLADRTGSMTLVFTRRDVPGVETGAQMVAEGTVGQHEGRLAMLNPIHEVLKRTPLDPIRG